MAIYLDWRTIWEMACDLRRAFVYMVDIMGVLGWMMVVVMTRAKVVLQLHRNTDTHTHKHIHSFACNVATIDSIINFGGCDLIVACCHRFHLNDEIYFYCHLKFIHISSQHYLSQAKGTVPICLPRRLTRQSFIWLLFRTQQQIKDFNAPMRSIQAYCVLLFINLIIERCRFWCDSKFYFSVTLFAMHLE